MLLFSPWATQPAQGGLQGVSQLGAAIMLLCC